MAGSRSRGERAGMKRLALRRTGEGDYATEDGRFVVCRGEAWTVCDAPHPVRLPRIRWRQDWRSDGSFGTVKADMCRGGEEHPYVVWGVVEIIDDRDAERGGPFDTKRQAVDWLTRHLERAAVQNVASRQRATP